MQTSSTQPRYRLPCVVKIQCEFDDGDENVWSAKDVWVFIACVAVGVIVIMLFCFVLCYCLKNYGVGGDASRPATAEVTPVGTP